LAQWTGHPGAYKKLAAAPVSTIRKGLSILFDEAIPLENRLRDIERLNLLPGLRIPSVGLFLYWRTPSLYVPFNTRTKRFLKDFHLQRSGMSAASIDCYLQWLDWAEDLTQNLALPSVGHVDRIVERYYESLSR
jgi:hypothetical protein